MTTKKKKSAREKRVLIASLIVAATIVAGSTFAWFTSEDEVTNRLSAKAEYNVSLTETFTPPEEWVPGQEVNKDVFAVNTGNVDALVKETVSSKLRITTEAASTDNLNTQQTPPTGAVKLSTEYRGSTDTSTGVTTYSADEVTSVMAGSVLAYTTNPGDVALVGNLTINVDGTTKLGTNPDSTQAPGSETETAPGESAEGTLFTPGAPGVYIFRRAVSNDFEAGETYTYSGFYFDGTYYYKLKVNSTALTSASPSLVGANGVLTGALTKKEVTDLTGKVTTTYELNDTMKQTVLGALNWVVDSTEVTAPVLTFEAEKTGQDAHPARLVAKYEGKDSSNSADDLIIYINLENIDNTGEAANKWQMLPILPNNGDTEAVFYYTNDLEAGHTSTQLINSVTLSEETKSEAYKSFDFDLDIALKSIQVALASDGTELIPGATKSGTPTAVTEFGANIKATATNSDTPNTKEISVIKWSNT